MSPAFQRYIGIDYSGAQTPTDSLPGLRIYQANPLSPAVEVMPPPSPRKYWTRQEIAEWLVDRLSGRFPILVGIDHGFSFPLKYFEKYSLPLDWAFFLEDFQQHWPTDGPNMYVDFVRDGFRGNGAARCGNKKWRRITELRARAAKSVFHFDCTGSVAKSTHAGIPWLHYLRQRVGERVHFWPFDGWTPPPGRSVIAEVYPALWNKEFLFVEPTRDQHDAYCIAEWLRVADAEGSLHKYLSPQLESSERKTAEIEGWILGVM